MRIAFVVHDYNRMFGHSRYVAELAARFSRTHDVHVFANRFDGLPEHIRGHHVPAVRFSALSTILTFAAPATMMVGRGFDIVHAQGFSVARPDVITAHISNARWLERRRHLENGRIGWRERVFGNVVTPLERRALVDPATTVIAVSRALGEDLQTLYGRRGPVEVIHHGVDDGQFNARVRERLRARERREIGLVDGEVLLLYVGDLRKGLSSVLQALGRVPGVRLLAVSRSDPGPFKEAAAAAGVASRVAFRSSTPEIERFYAAADIFVLPTPYDAFGMVITEAMACGLPVITTPAAGAAELITHDINGLLVDDASDVEGLARAMRRLTADEAMRRRIGDSAARVMQDHTWDRVAERTWQVYERHLARRTQ